MKAAAERVKESLRNALGAVRERLQQVNQEMTQIQERIEAVRGRIVELRTNQAQDYAHAVVNGFVGLLPPEVQGAFREISSSDEFSDTMSALAVDCAQSCEDGNVEKHKEKYAASVREKLLDIGRQLGLAKEQIQELEKKLREFEAEHSADFLAEPEEIKEFEKEKDELTKQLEAKNVEKKTLETQETTLETQLTEADGLVHDVSRSLQDGVHDVSQASPGEERGETPSGQTTKDANDVKWKTTRPPTISLGG